MKQFKLSGCTTILIISLMVLVKPWIVRADCGGPETSRQIVTENFRNLAIAGDARVFISQGSTPAVTIKAQKGVLEDLDVEFSSGWLRIEPDDCNENQYTVHVTMRELQTLQFKGNVKAHSQSPLQGNRMALILSGSHEVKLEIGADRLEIDLSGSTELELSGSASKVAVDGKGSTELDAKALLTDEWEIDVAGSSAIFINVRNSLKADLSGSSEVGYLGTPKINIKTSGSSKVKTL